MILLVLYFYLWKFKDMLSAYKDELKPGSYELSTSMTIEEMLQIMSMEAEE